MTATTAPRGTAVSTPRVLLLVLLVLAGFGAAFAIGKATAGSAEQSEGVRSIQLPASKPKAPAIAAPAALPGLRAAPARSGGGSPSSPSGDSGTAAPSPSPAPVPAPAPAPAPAPPSGGGGGGGGGPIIEG
jgi:peptidoglycan DL-endopeptidase CwlO